jgi:hypothetical protein
MPHRICTAATAADFQLVPWQWRIAIKYAAFANGTRCAKAHLIPTRPS